MAEEESYKTSRRTKQSFKKNGVTSISYKGNIVGKKYKNTNNEFVTLTAKQINSLHEKIDYLIKDYESKRMSQYYPLIMQEIERAYKLRISKSLITKIKSRSNGRNTNN